MRALIFDVFGTCVDWRTSISAPPLATGCRPNWPTPGARSISQSLRPCAPARGHG